MSDIKRKIVAIATVLTVAAFVAGPGAAQGATIDDIQKLIAEYTTQLAALQAQLNAAQGVTGSTGTVTGCTVSSFTRNLKQGITGADVKCLQIILNSDATTKIAASGAGSPGAETTYFGGLTKAAVVKMQEKYASAILTPVGLTKGTGFVGASTRAKLNTMIAGSGGGTPIVTPITPITPITPTANFAEGVKVALASDNPAAHAVAKGAYDREFTKLLVTAGTASSYTITSLTVHRDGLADDNDLSEVKLYDGATQLGTTQALNTVTYKATFSGINLVIPAGTSKILTLKGSIDATNGTQGNSPSLGIKVATDVVVTGSPAILGTFPVYGNVMTIAGASVGQMDVDANDNTVTGDVISGSTDQKIGSIKFTASATEGFDVQQLKLTEVGTSVDGDVTNVKIKYLGTVLGTVVTLTGSQAIFTGSPLFTVKAGTTKDIDIYGDIASGVRSERTVRFEITEYADVTAVGQNTGGVVRATYSSGTAFTNQRSSIWTVKQGTITVAYDTATNPSSQYYSVGYPQATIASFKFSAGSREAVKVTQLKLNATGTAGVVSGTTYTQISDNEFQSVQLYLNNASSSTGYVGSISSGVMTFSDSNGLFTIPKSGNIVVVVKADITTAADLNDTLGFYVSAVTNLKLKGVDSNEEIYNDADHITLSGIGQGNATIHIVKDKGTLIVSSSPDTPAARSVSLGDTAITLLKVRLAAEYEDVAVSSIKVRFFNDAAITAAANDAESTSTGYIANVKLYDGATLLNEQGTPSAGYVTFSTGNLTVAKGETKTLTVVVDIPTGSNLQYLAAELGTDAGDSTTAAADMTSTGKSSGQDISETGVGLGNSFTLSAPTLVIAAASTPAAQYIVSNTTEAWLGRLQLTGSNENIKVTKVTVTFDDNTILGNINSASTVFSNIKLKVGSTQIGVTKQITDGGGSGGQDIAAFSGIENLTVTKDQTVSLDIYAQTTATSTDTALLTWFVGHASNSDIIGSGVSSNTAVTSSGGKQASKGTTLLTSGTLTVSVDASTPVAANQAVGLYGKKLVDFAKLKFDAEYEAMKVKTLKLTLIDSGGYGAGTSTATTTANSYDFDKVYLYDGATKLAETVVDATAFTANFVSDSALFTVPNGESKVITVKADVMGLSTGAFAGDSPAFYIAWNQDTTQINGVGVNSSASTTATDGSPNPETYTEFGAQWLYKTIITVAKNSASPSGSATAGAGAEVLRFDVAADSQADAVLNTVAVAMSGTADLSSGGTGSAYLYKATDLTTPLATEVSKSFTLDPQFGATIYTTTWVTTTPANAEGIPVGSTLHFYDASGAAWYTTKLTQVDYDYRAGGITGSRLVFSPALTVTPTGSDIVYYQPLQPGPGKTYFGGSVTYLKNASGEAGNPDYSNTTTTVDSTDGFAMGDAVVIRGYDAAGNATNTATLTVATTTATVLHYTGAINVKFDYDYNVTSAIDAAYSRPWVMISSASTTRNIEDAIAKGETTTYVVKGDTTGAASTKTIRADIAAVADLKWDDKVLSSISARTKNLPITGGTLVY